MKLCTTTEDFRAYYANDADKLRELAAAGFRYADLSMYNNEAAAYMHVNWREDIKRLKDEADKLGVSFVQAHSPAFETLETLSPTEDPVEKTRQTIRSIEICGELGIPMTVVHAGVKRNTPQEETFRLNKEFYQKLVPAMEATGVMVLVENVGIADNNGRFYMNSAQRLLDFLDYFDHPLLGVCWDIGHANVFGKQHDEIVKLGKHLKAIHYNDNDRQDDLHTSPFLSKLDNDDAMRGLMDAGFQGPFTFEATGKIQGKLKRFERQTGSTADSLPVARAYEKALYETGKYLLSTYGVFED